MTSRIGAGRLAAGALGAALVGLPALAGCTSSAPPAPAKTPAQELADVKGVIDAASSVHLAITSQDLPSGADGIVAADGVGTHAPAFKGTFTVRAKGVQADASVVAVGGATYAKLPFVPVWQQVDPASLGAPDPASLFSTSRGITTLLTSTQNPVKGEAKRNGAEVLTPYSGTLPGQAIHDLLQVGDTSGSFTVTYGVTDAQQLRTVTLSGPFYGASSTYAMTLDHYGDPVTITKP